MQLLYSVLFLTIFLGVSCEDLTPIKKEEYCLEGTSVTLSYNYSRTATAGDEFYWYHQDTAQRPEFFLYISGTEFIKKADPLNTRISAKLNKEKTRVDLEISSADVTDSALYYCAVKPTVTGNLHTLYKNLSRDHISRNLTSFFIKLVYNPYFVDIKRVPLIFLNKDYDSNVLWLNPLLVLLAFGLGPLAVVFPVSPLAFLIGGSQPILLPWTVVRAKPPSSRLTVKLNKKKTCTDLEISSVEVRDCSVLLYCTAHSDSSTSGTAKTTTMRMLAKVDLTEKSPE
eukprot:XP_013995569.1 PREDICTED: uncharacterized protein LOC106569109 [Salmo salar]